MTFLQACMSGKKFRRPCFAKNNYWWIEDGHPVCYSSPKNKSQLLYVFEPSNDDEENTELLNEFCATDWEVLE